MFQLKTMTIENFKGFHEKISLDFAIPNKRTGSGMTVLVGQNGGGKSSIFDAILKFHRGQKILLDERRPTEVFKIRIDHLMHGKDFFVSISNPTKSSSLVFDGNDNTIMNGVVFVSSRRQWDYRFKGEKNIKGYTNSRFQEGKSTGVDRELGIILQSIFKHKPQEEKFLALIREVIPEFHTCVIETDDIGDYIVYVSSSGMRHKASYFGDGAISIIRILAHLTLLEEGTVLLIDEPELSLNTQAKKKLGGILSRFSKDFQIVVATHDTNFVSWDNFSNGASIIRFKKVKDEKCLVYQLKDSGFYHSKSLNLTENWQKPQLLDTVAKEIFFSRNILFVEGQEDVGLIRKFLKEEAIDINFEFFGYGSGGAENIYKFLDMARDLGLNAGALFDGDKDGEREKCEREFEKYIIQGISTLDIRDKMKRNEKGKETTEIDKQGLFDKSGNIKLQCKAELSEIIAKFNHYFESCEFTEARDAWNTDCLMSVARNCLAFFDKESFGVEYVDSERRKMDLSSDKYCPTSERVLSLAKDVDFYGKMMRQTNPRAIKQFDAFLGLMVKWEKVDTQWGWVRKEELPALSKAFQSEDFYK